MHGTFLHRSLFRQLLFGFSYQSYRTSQDTNRFGHLVIEPHRALMSQLFIVCCGFSFAGWYFCFLVASRVSHKRLIYSHRSVSTQFKSFRYVLTIYYLIYLLIMLSSEPFRLKTLSLNVRGINQSIKRRNYSGGCTTSVHSIIFYKKPIVTRNA